MIKQVTKFETEDGECFDTEKEAERHEAELTLANWCEKNKLYSSNGSYIYPEDFLEWFKKHRSELLNFLNKIS